MGRRREVPPPRDQIEQDFMDAFKRLLDGTPNNKVLKATKAKGTLKINASNVALEAGHSRTLISLQECRYPRVREAILLAKEGAVTEPRTYGELIERLRAELAEARAQVRLYQAEVVSKCVAFDKSMRALQKAEHEIGRLNAEKEQLTNSPKSGKVVPLVIKK